MDARRALWIYAGLGLAAGVGLVMASSSSSTAAPTGGPGPAGGPAPGGVPLLRPGDRVLLIGDSLAQGLGTPMKQLLGNDFRADGRVGTRIVDWAPYQVPAPGPNLVLISLGTNDMRMMDPTTEQSALAALLAKFRGTRVAWIAPPTMPFPDRGVRAMLARAGVPIFPSDSLVIPRGPDQIHPTVIGYAGWAGNLVTWLRRLR